MMPSGSRCLPPQHDAHDAAKWTTLTTLPSDILKTMNGMHSIRHHVDLSFCVRALSKGIWLIYGSSLIVIDACHKKRILEQGIGVPKKSCTICDWVFPKGTGSSARHPNRLTPASLSVADVEALKHIGEGGFEPARTRFFSLKNNPEITTF
eukprot:355500-Pelagomonas_calceolata.AAC.5